MKQISPSAPFCLRCKVFYLLIVPHALLFFAHVLKKNCIELCQRFVILLENSYQLNAEDMNGRMFFTWGSLGITTRHSYSKLRSSNRICHL